MTPVHTEQPKRATGSVAVLARHQIVPAAAAHTRLLRAGLRAGDRHEVTCLGVSVERAIWRSFRDSLVARTILVDGEIAAMFGLGGESLSDTGTPWLLTTAAVERVPIALVKEGKRQVAAMLDVFPKLSGFVAAEYEQACGLLRLLGFDLSEPFPFGPYSAPFRRYTLVRR